MSGSEIHEVAVDRPDPRPLGIASLGLVVVALVAAARRSSELDELSIPELPGVVGGLFLAVLVAATLETATLETATLETATLETATLETATLETARPTTPRRSRSAAAAIVWAPILAAYAHTLARWAGDALRGATSSLLAVALVAFLVAWIPERSDRVG